MCARDLCWSTCGGTAACVRIKRVPLSQLTPNKKTTQTPGNTEKGGDPEIVRESQRRRYADVSLVDKVVQLDNEWRAGE